MEKSLIALYCEHLDALFPVEKERAERVSDLAYGCFGAYLSKEQRPSLTNVLKWSFILKRNKLDTARISLPLYKDGDYVTIRDYLVLSSILVSLIEQFEHSNDPSYKDVLLFDFIEERLSAFSKLENGRIYYADIAIELGSFTPLFQPAKDRKKLEVTLSELFPMLLKYGTVKALKAPQVVDTHTRKALLLTGCKHPNSRLPFIRKDLSDLELPFVSLINEGVIYDRGIVQALSDTHHHIIISLSWPYNIFSQGRFLQNKQIKRDQTIILELKKRFNVNDECEPNTLLLTPNEISKERSFYDYIDIETTLISIPTSHEYIQLINEIETIVRSEKKRNRLNTSPLKWIFLINTANDAEGWQNEFRRCFPNVSTDLLQHVDELITYLLKDAWIEKALEQYRPQASTLNVLLPKHHTYNEITRTVKQLFLLHLDNVDLRFIDHDDLLTLEEGEVWIFDLNSNILYNLPSHLSVKVFMPDTTYAAYGVFIPLQLFRKDKEIVQSQLRAKVIGERMNPLIQHMIEIESLVKKNLREKLRALPKRKRDASVNEEEIVMIEAEEESSEILYSFQHERDTEQEQDKRRASHLVVSDICNTNYILSLQEKVLVRYKGQIVYTKAKSLRRDDDFLTFKNARVQLSMLDSLFKDLTSLPSEVRDWKEQLSKIKNARAVLAKMLNDQNFISKDWFDKQWVVKGSEIEVPRKRNHWNAICRLLAYDDVICSRAWYQSKLHFVTTKKNEILSAFFEEDRDDNLTPPIQNLYSILSQYTDIEGSADITKAAQLLRLEIEKNLSFSTIKDITLKETTYEHCQ